MRGLERRYVLAALAAVVAVGLGWFVASRLLDDDSITDEDRDALERAVAAGGSENAYDAVIGLASDDDRWRRLVVHGDRDLADLLDRALVATADDEATSASRAATVVAPLLDGADVDDEVLAALARWAWPLLQDPASEPEATVALFDAAQSDEHLLAAVSDAREIARLHIILVAIEVDVAGWADELAVVRRGSEIDAENVLALESRSHHLPAPVIADLLAHWGRTTSGASNQLRDRVLAIGFADPKGSVGAFEAKYAAGYLRLIDDTDATAAAGILVDETVGQYQDEVGDTLHHLTFDVDDPALGTLRDDVYELIDG